MGLLTGTRVGAYETVAPLGAGGMGEVYRARDPRLNRDVAIKILPDAFALDADRLARFTREAQTLAALNHPNIAQMYGLEEWPGGRALIMELVEGDDLSTILARGAMPLAEALPVARQIAEALESAHDLGIVHRDLKPANVKVRDDGAVKVLDFGLAKAADPAGASGARSTDTPTLTAHQTAIGTVVGTVAYMAPEQARGKSVDKRADIWAFGAVLYEMITGVRAFKGEDSSDVLAAVLRHEIDWSKLPVNTPAPLRQLLMRTLEPDLKQRLRDIGEARIAIAEIERGGSESTSLARARTAAPRNRREVVAWSLASLGILAAAALLLQRLAFDRPTPVAKAAMNRLAVLAPPGRVINPDSTNVAISPDGRMVAFTVGAGISVENQLWVRDLGSSTPRRIESADGAALPFWSPDSQRIGFFAGQKLKTVAAAGGAAQTLASAPFGRGGAWNASNVIVFAPDANGPLYSIPAGGGTPSAVTALDTARKEAGHRFPAFLPDGEHFLFAATPGAEGKFQIFVGSVSGSTAKTPVGALESAPVYAEPGALLFTQDGILTARPFDAATLQFSGDAQVLGDQPAVAAAPAAYDAGRRVSASREGSLAFFTSATGDTIVEWIDPAGKITGRVGVPAGRYSEVAIAPDGTRAVLVRADSSATSSLWLVDLTRASAVPLPIGSGRNWSPIWSPDSKRVAFTSDRGGQNGIFEQSVVEASPERLLYRPPYQAALPRGWSPDGAWIVINQVAAGSKWNVYRLPASGSPLPVAIADGPGIEAGGSPSPNGKWLAFVSEETGRLDLFVQSFPEPRTKVQISSAGALLYWWQRDGRALFFVDRDHTLWRVQVDLEAATPRIGAPIEVAAFPASLISAAATPDGKRFLALVPESSGPGSITIVQSWRGALPAR